MSSLRKNYDNADIVITLLGSQPLNFAGVTYGDEEEAQANYGRGQNTIGWSKGSIKFDDTVLSLGMEEVVQIQTAAGGNIIKLKPFDILVTYLNEDYGIVTDKITVKFRGKKTSSKSGDMNLVHDLQCLTLGIVYDYK